MSMRPVIAAAALAFLTMLRPDAALADPATTGALNVPANRIVGLWSTLAELTPCGGGPTFEVTNNLLFHAGGTLTENIAPTPARNHGLGTWSYNAGSGWQLHLRFDRFADDAYAGFTTVDRELHMSPDGRELTGPVHATFYGADGSVLQELCGEATSTRLQ
jgi:hypothetical protein